MSEVTSRVQDESGCLSQEGSGASGLRFTWEGSDDSAPLCGSVFPFQFPHSPASLPSPCAGCFSGELDSLGCLTQSRLNFPDIAEIFFFNSHPFVPHLGLRQGFFSNGKKAIHIPEPALCLDVC